MLLLAKFMGIHENQQHAQMPIHVSAIARVYFFTEALTEFLHGNVKSTKSIVHGLY